MSEKSGLILFSILASVVFASCSTNSIYVQRDVRKMIGTKILLPQFEEIDMGGNRWLPDTTNSPKIIVYFSSKNCGNCILDSIIKYEDIYDLSSGCGLFCPMVILGYIDEKSRREFILKIKESRVPFPVFLDEKDFFLKTNRQLRPEVMTHSFLVDSDNRIRIIGNPVDDEIISLMLRELTRLNMTVR